MALLSLSDRPKMVPGELPVDEQAVAAGLGMGAHDRVEGGQQLVAPCAVPLVAATLGDVGGEPGVVVNGDQLVAHGAHRCGEPVVGVLQAGPHGVAADVGRLEHVEDGAHRRRLQEGDVGVPPAGPVHLAVDGEHLAALLDGGQHGVGLGHDAELAGECGLLVGGEGLVAEEDDVVGVQRVADARPLPRAPAGARCPRPEISAPMVGGEGVDAEGGGEGHGPIVPEPASVASTRPRDPPVSGSTRPAYIGPPTTTLHRQKGPSMSEDTGGLVLTPPARNYSPWYQWMTRLAATTHEDPLPERDPAGHAGLGGAAPGPPGRAPRARARGGPARPRDARVGGSATAIAGTRSSSTPRTPCRSPPTSWSLMPGWTSRPGPAVLACHGHGPGKTQVVGLEHTDMPNADYALQLVRRGYVVLAPDLRCFGERLDWNPEDHYACDTNLVHAAMAGWNPLAQNIWDLRRSLDVLEQHPLVDPERLGMVGISYGGTVTLFTAAVDSRVAASVVSGYFSSWAESHRMPWNMCGSQILFGMLGRLEHEDLGALGGATAAARGVRHRGRPLPVCGRQPSRCAVPGSSTSSWARATGWCTTSSRAGTSGTARKLCPSSTAGSASSQPETRDRADSLGGRRHFPAGGHGPGRMYIPTR